MPSCRDWPQNVHLCKYSDTNRPFANSIEKSPLFVYLSRDKLVTITWLKIKGSNYKLHDLGRLIHWKQSVDGQLIKEIAIQILVKMERYASEKGRFDLISIGFSTVKLKESKNWMSLSCSLKCRHKKGVTYKTIEDTMQVASSFVWSKPFSFRQRPAASQSVPNYTFTIGYQSA